MRRVREEERSLLFGSKTSFLLIISSIACYRMVVNVLILEPCTETYMKNK